MREELTTGTMRLSFDGILLVSEVMDEKDIEAEDVRENVEAARKLTGDRKYLSLVISAPYTSITYEGRKEADRTNNYHNTIAQAIVVKNLANKIMGNFIIKFHRPPCPCRLFNDRETALAWLYAFTDREKKSRKKNKRAGTLPL